MKSFSRFQQKGAGVVAFVEEEFLHQKIEKRRCFQRFEHKTHPEEGSVKEYLWSLLKAIM